MKAAAAERRRRRPPAALGPGLLRLLLLLVLLAGGGGGAGGSQWTRHVPDLDPPGNYAGGVPVYGADGSAVRETASSLAGRRGVPRPRRFRAYPETHTAPPPPGTGRAVVVESVASYSPDGHYGAGDTLHLLVKLSGKVRVDVSGGAPTLALATGRHHERGARGGEATFVAGGFGEAKAAWLNNAPNPLKTGLAPPCRAGGLTNASLHGPAACVLAGPEVRLEQNMDDLLLFTYTVREGERTERLDVRALRLNGCTLEPVTEEAVGAARAGQRNAADRARLRAVVLDLPAPGDEMRGLRGTAGSLSRSSAITVGPAYVTNVTVFQRDAFGIFEGTQGAWLGPTRPVYRDRVQVNVTFSEAVAVHCPAWRRMPALDTEFFGKDFRCEDIRMRFGNGPLTTDSTTGTYGQVVFPTGFLHAATDRPAATRTLHFVYEVRKGDELERRGLEYVSQDALEVLAGGANITRALDGTPAGVRLPPLPSFGDADFYGLEAGLE